jgi:mannose-6-phosphate isomerase-like protein (cupin superfamily)
MGKTPAAYAMFSQDELESIRKNLCDKPSTQTIYKAADHSVSVGRLHGRNGRPEMHRHSGRLFMITAGTGLIRLGGTIADAQESSPGEYLGREDALYVGYEVRSLHEGVILSIAAGTPYQLMATARDFAFIVIRLP